MDERRLHGNIAIQHTSVDEPELPLLKLGFASRMVSEKLTSVPSKKSKTRQSPNEAYEHCVRIGSSL